jgi:hypothetical protein
MVDSLCNLTFDTLTHAPSRLPALRRADVREARLSVGDVAACVSDGCDGAVSVHFLQVWEED